MPTTTEVVPGLGGVYRTTRDGRELYLNGLPVAPDGNGWWLSHPDDISSACWYTPSDLRERTYGHPIGCGGHTFNADTDIAYTPGGDRVDIVQVATTGWNRSATEAGVILHYLNDADEEVTVTLRISELLKGAGASSIVPGHYRAPDYDDDDDGDAPAWYRRFMPSSSEVAPSPQPPAPSSMRGRMGGQNSQRGRMGR